MYPALRTGDQLLLAEQTAFLTGEIYVYRSGGKFVAHRLVSVGDDFILFRGDALSGREKISRDQVVGRVKLVMRGSRIIPAPVRKSRLSFLYRLLLPLLGMALKNRKKTPQHSTAVTQS